MKKKKKIGLSQDEMIKDLILDYPKDALEYVNPKIFEKYGLPVKIDYKFQENKKYSHFDPKRINDIAIIYEFSGGQKVVLVLFEHWSDKNRFNIHRLAHYFIDLDKRFPGCEKYPVVLFTDKAKTWRKQPQREIEIRCLDEVFLKFRYKLVRLKADQAEKYKNTKNKFAAVVRGAMDWKAENKVLLAFDFIKVYCYIEKDINILRKHMDIISFYLGLTEEEVGELMRLIERGEQETMMTLSQKMESVYQERGLKKGIEEGLQKGLQKGRKEGIEEGLKKGVKKGKLDAAVKMVEKGFSIKEILDITGLKKKDLLQAEIIEE